MFQNQIHLEITTEKENAARVIQRGMRSFLNRRWRRWRPQTLASIGSDRMQELEAKIKEHLNQPFPVERFPAWDNNPNWLREEASKSFHEYRCRRSDEKFAHHTRLSHKAHI